MLIMKLRHSYSIGYPLGKILVPRGRVSCALRTTFVYSPYYNPHHRDCQPLFENFYRDFFKEDSLCCFLKD